MPKNKNVPNRDNDVNNSTDFDLYSDDKTKEIVGSLFDEFVEDGGTNYFADYKDPFLDGESEEEEESLGESISRRRKRSSSNEGKSIVFRKKTKKAKPEDEYDDYDKDTYEDTDDKAEDNDDNEDNGSDLEKTIILPKLSSLFKKAEKEDEDDDEIDEFFASLTKDSAARAQAAASQESEGEEKQEEKPRRQHKAQSVQKNVEKEDEEVSEQPKPRKRVRPAVVTEPETDDDDDLEERLVEISVSRIASIAVIIIAVVIIAALAYKNHSYAKQLDEARAQITELQKNSSSTYETELDELKKQVSELTAENESLKADDAAEDPHATAIEILNEAQSEITTQSSDASLSQGVSGGNTYTVKAGDTIEKISKNQYGNVSGVQKILQANNLTESSTLQIGQVLTIPN